MEDKYPKIGGLLRERRKLYGWTLGEVSKMTGLSVSTISKIETGQMSPSYDKIIQIAKGLDVEIADIFEAKKKPEEIKHIMGRRSIVRANEGLEISADRFHYSYLCNELAHKHIIPVVVTVKARSVDDMGQLIRLPGEQFVYVLEGKIRLFSEFYEPADLDKGDGVYMDSTMGHTIISLAENESQVLISHSSSTPNLAQTIREIITEHIADEI